MGKTVTSRYDVAEHLRTPEEMAAYFEACLEGADGDAAFIAKALGDIARAKGMAQVARDAGLSRESLYKALSGERSPDFETILKVVGALGLELHAKAAGKDLEETSGSAERQSAVSRPGPGVAKPLVKSAKVGAPRDGAPPPRSSGSGHSKTRRQRVSAR